MAATHPPPPPPPSFNFSIHPSLAPLNTPMHAYLTQHPSPSYTVLATASLIFTRDPDPRLLLLQRSAHDSMPHHWEPPGGAVDASDATILAGAAREVWEETGLKVVALNGLVGKEPTVFRNGRGLGVCKFTVEAEVEGLVLEGRVGMGERGKGVEVRLDPNEHQRFLWLSEDECRAGEVWRGEERVGIRFTTEAQKEVVLEGFRMRSEGRE